MPHMPRNRHVLHVVLGNPQHRQKELDECNEIDSGCDVATLKEETRQKSKSLLSATGWSQDAIQHLTGEILRLMGSLCSSCRSLFKADGLSMWPPCHPAAAGLRLPFMPCACATVAVQQRKEYMSVGRTKPKGKQLLGAHCFGTFHMPVMPAAPDHTSDACLVCGVGTPQQRDTEDRECYGPRYNMSFRVVVARHNISSTSQGLSSEGEARQRPQRGSFQPNTRF
jgi:hypothetical protein